MKNLLTTHREAEAKDWNLRWRCSLRPGTSRTETVEHLQPPAGLRSSRTRSPLWFLIEMRSRRRRSVLDDAWTVPVGLPMGRSGTAGSGTNH